MRWPMGFASLSLLCGALASHLSAAPAANAAWLCSVVASGLLVAALAKSRVEAGARTRRRRVVPGNDPSGCPTGVELH